MERKVGDFLPEEVKEEINEAFVLAIERFIDCDQSELENAIDDFLNIWGQRTTAEFKGVKPVKKTLGGLAEFFFCGHCEDCEVCWTEHGDRNNYCPNCGTKIDWESGFH